MIAPPARYLLASLCLLLAAASARINSDARRRLALPLTDNTWTETTEKIQSLHKEQARIHRELKSLGLPVGHDDKLRHELEAVNADIFALKEEFAKCGDSIPEQKLKLMKETLDRFQARRADIEQILQKLDHDSKIREKLIRAMKDIDDEIHILTTEQGQPKPSTTDSLPETLELEERMHRLLNERTHIEEEMKKLGISAEFYERDPLVRHIERDLKAVNEKLHILTTELGQPKPSTPVSLPEFEEEMRSLQVRRAEICNELKIIDEEIRMTVQLAETRPKSSTTDSTKMKEEIMRRLDGLRVRRAEICDKLNVIDERIFTLEAELKNSLL